MFESSLLPAIENLRAIIKRIPALAKTKQNPGLCGRGGRSSKPSEPRQVGQCWEPGRHRLPTAPKARQPHCSASHHRTGAHDLPPLCLSSKSPLQTLCLRFFYFSLRQRKKKKRREMRLGTTSLGLSNLICFARPGAMKVTFRAKSLVEDGRPFISHLLINSACDSR